MKPARPGRKTFREQSPAPRRYDCGFAPGAGFGSGFVFFGVGLDTPMLIST
jgi:hypothetical protein